MLLPVQFKTCLLCLNKSLLALSGGLVEEKVAFCASLFVVVLPLPGMWDLLL